MTPVMGRGGCIRTKMVHFKIQFYFIGDREEEEKKIKHFLKNQQKKNLFFFFFLHFFFKKKKTFLDIRSDDQ